MQIEFGFINTTILSQLIREQNELNNKLIRLTEFKAGKEYIKLDLATQRDLTDQHYFMTGYLNVLTRRVDRLKEKDGRGA